MLKCAIPVVLLLAAAVRPACALDASGTYFVRGTGNELCAAYSIARNEHRDAAFVNWLAGYLTAFDRWTADVYDIEGATGFEGSLHWLDYYCHTNPQIPFATAAASLVANLYPNRTRAAHGAANGAAPR